MNTLNLFVDTQKLKNMKEKYQPIDAIRSEVRRFTEKRTSEDQFNKYVFIDKQKNY